MKKMITDYPKNNFETVLNMVYDKDGWQYIRHGETGIPTTDFCLSLCMERGCDDIPPECIDTQEKKDELLCGCTEEGCPIATIYAALSGFGHVRHRLKMYEDANIVPPERCNGEREFFFVVQDGGVDPDTGEKEDLGMKVKFNERATQQEVIAFVTKQFPVYSGRLRPITEEEYVRGFGDDDD